MATVRFENVTKTFDDRHRGKVFAVKNASFEIQDGEFVVFLGPSGCGKTTSLRLVGGLEVPTGGNIWIGDRIVNRMHPRARNVAMVFQDYALYPHMTVNDNLSFALRNLKMPRAEIRKKVDNVADLLQITPLLRRKPRELSGGQRQRVALGRAIVREPQVFLFDEPLSNLDAKLRVAMRIELIELHEKLGVTSIYVTHDQVEAMTLGQRIVVMNDGVVQQVDEPTRIYDHPDSMFVAGFLGSPPMNLIKGKLTGNAEFTGEGYTIKLPAAFADQHRSVVGKDLVLGIRPEDIAVAGPDATNTQKVRVRVLENLGAESIVYFEVGQQTSIARVPPVVAMTMAPHKDATLTFDYKRAAIFDPETARRITP